MKKTSNELEWIELMAPSVGGSVPWKGLTLVTLGFLLRDYLAFQHFLQLFKESKRTVADNSKD